MLLGATMLLFHIYTLPTPQPVQDLFHRSWRDFIYHGSMTLAFALAYRLSFRGRASYLPELALLCVCSGWGATCELLQLLLEPVRQFDPLELALNSGAPALLAGLLALVPRQK